MKRKVGLTLLVIYLVIAYRFGAIYITETSFFGEHNRIRSSKQEVAAAWIMSPILVPYVIGERLYYRYFRERKLGDG